jgi:hypothetical protein
MGSEGSVNVDTVLWFAGTAGEAGVIALLVYRRMWRSFPVFFFYCVWTLIAGAVGYVLFRSHFTKYATFYLVESIVDSTALFGVIVELTWSVLRPLRPKSPRRLLFIISGLILLVGAAIWPFSAVTGQHKAQVLLIMHLQQTFYVLRVLVFLALAACSQYLAIGWRNRELQIATGLGLTSLVSLGVAMLHAYPSMTVQYALLNRLVVVSFVCSVFYWIVSFSQKEEKRREFSPQMQSLLLAVAGTARTTRIALSESPAGKAREEIKRS